MATTTKKTPAKIVNEKEFAEMFQSLSSVFGGCEPMLFEAKTLIEETECIKKPTKKLLLSHMENIFAEMNAIMDKIGKMGKVK